MLNYGLKEYLNLDDEKNYLFLRARAQTYIYRKIINFNKFNQTKRTTEGMKGIKLSKMCHNS